MEPTRLPDPFAIQTDPRLYVPRRATEEALDALERSVSSPHAVVCFTGPPGLGKTLLLRVLAAELAPGLRTAYLPYPRLPADGIWTWVAKELALDSAHDAKEALRRSIGELAAEGRALLLEIDDASSLPAETLAELTDFARVEPALRVVLAFSEHERPTDPLPGDLPVVRLDQAMSRTETQDYVKERLERCDVPRSVVARFDTATVARLHRESAGNPLRVHALAVAVMREADEPSPAAEGGAVDEPRADSLAPRGERSEPSAAPLPERAEPIPSPSERRLEPIPAPSEQRVEETSPAPVERPARRRRPVASRSRARSPRDSHRRLARGLWGATGLCIGFVAGVGLGRWAAGDVGIVGRAGPQTVSAPASPAQPDPLPVRPTAEPAPPARAPEPAPAPAVAAAPPASEPAPAGAAAPPAPGPADASPSGAGPALAIPPEPEAALHEGTGPSTTGAAPPEEARPAEPPVAPARSDPALPEAAGPVPSPAPLATGRLFVEADAEVLVEIDGRRFGPAPLSGIRLSRGPHRVIAHYRDGGVGQKTVYLGDEDVSVTFR